MTQPVIERRYTPPDEIISLWHGYARPDSYIAFGSRRPFLKADGSPDTSRDPAPRFFTLLPVTAGQLYFPAFIARLWEDSATGYVGTQTFKKSAMHRYRRERTPVPEAEYLAPVAGSLKEKPVYFHFATHHVRELTCILLDLDVGRKNTVPLAEAVGALVGRALFGHIPHPSMIAYSGAGAYAMWLLKQRNSEHPPLHTKRTNHLWHLCVEELLGKVADLSPDRNASKRLAGWVKAPATLDYKTGESVVYLPFFVQQPGQKPTVPRYALSDLVREMDIITADDDTPALPAAPDGKGKQHFVGSGFTWTRPTSGKGHNAHEPLMARCRDMEALAAARRKIREGQRHTALRYYFSAVWGAYAIQHRDDAFKLAAQKLKDFNRRWCRPPLPAGEIKKILKSKYRERTRSKNVCGALRISSREAEALNLRNLVPPALREQRTRERQERGKEKRERRALIDRLIMKGKTNAEIYKSIPVEYRYTVCRRRQKLNVPHDKAQERLL